MICLSQKQHEFILSRMAQNNRNLKDLTKDSLDLEPSRLGLNRGTEPFRKFRDYAKGLHTMLRRGWCCTCTLAHSANLRLETHNTETIPSFRVLFPSANESSSTRSMQTTWNETLIRPLADDIWPDVDKHLNSVDTTVSRGLASVTVTDANCQVDVFSSTLHLGSNGSSIANQAHFPSALATGIRKEKKKVTWANRAETKLEPESSGHACGQKVLNPTEQKASLRRDTPIISISNLCHALKDGHYKGEVEKCLGHLTGDGRPSGVYVIGQHSPSTGLKTVTLRDILSREVGPYLGDAPKVSLTPKFRLELATLLASTALQLQTTPWLNSSWDSNDVLFHTGIAAHPYITKGFSSDANQPEEPVKLAEPSPVRNESIFNLGVLLLELCLGKPLDHFRTTEDSSIFTEFCIAKRLVENLAEEASSGYADAVTACIYCDFGREVKDHSLDNDAFRQAVYEYVVTPLEEEWRHFNRMRSLE